MKITSIKKVYDLFLLIFFLFFITTPLITAVLTEEKHWSEAEKRALEPLPALPTSLPGFLQFPSKFEQYYNDHFGFREQMVFRYQREMEKKFDVTGVRLVVKGRGKWLFYTGNKMFEDFRGELSLTNQELVTWRNEQQDRQRWLEQKGIHYLSFSPPNKHTIYPEFLPEDDLQLKGTTRMEQLHRFLSSNPLSSYVNVYDILNESKSLRNLYFYTDTHWNQYGAYVCFKEVMAKVQRLFPQESFTVNFPFHKNPRYTPGGDLARMLMIDREVSESNPKIRYRKNCSQDAFFDVSLTGVSSTQGEGPLLKKCPDAGLKAIIFSDSFIDLMEPFLSENFAQVLYLKKKYDKRNVEELLHTFRPDIVLEERVERNYFR